MQFTPFYVDVCFYVDEPKLFHIATLFSVVVHELMSYAQIFLALVNW